MLTAHIPKQALVAGLVSAGLYIIFFTGGLGAALMLIPSLPLLILGLHRPPRELLLAIALGSVAVAVASGVAGALFFISFLAIPILLFAPAAAWTDRPVGALLMDIAIYAGLLIAAAIAHLSAEGGITQLINNQLNQQFAQAQPPLRDALERLGNSLTILVLGATGWWWTLLLYAHAALANWILASRGLARRGSLALAPFSLPGWLLPLLALCGLLSLVGQGDVALVGKVCLMVLLLPYFLLGLSLLHEKVKTLPGRGLLLFTLYFFTFSLVWPALIIAAVGIWQQCRTVARNL